MKQSILIWACILFISCQNEISSETNSNTPGNTNITPLRALIGLDTTKQPPFDTTYTYKFSYDVNGRISRITLNDYFNTGAFVTIFWDSKYIYQGADSLPTKITTIIDDFSVLHDTMFFTFSSANPRKLLHDSSVTDDTDPLQPVVYGISNHYTYSQGQIKNDSREYADGAERNNYSTHVYLAEINGNIFTQTDTIFGLYYPGSVIVENFTKQFNNTINPFNSFFGWGQPPYLTEPFDYTIPFGRNLQTEINFSFSDETGASHQKHRKLIYSYDSVGRPNEAVLQIIAGGSLDHNKLKFLY